MDNQEQHKRLPRKWLVPDPQPGLREKQQHEWEELYQRGSLDKVMSLVEDEAAMNLVLEALKRQSECRDILIPGCGTRVALQRVIVETGPETLKVTCTDYAGVVGTCAEAFSHERVRYVDADTTRLPWDSAFDAVLIVNSIVSGSDSENRDMLESCSRALRPGAVLIGFFPTIFCALDIALLEGNADKMLNIDLARSLCYEEVQDVSQVFYSPLRLRRILHESGLRVELMSVFFCDSDYFSSEGRRLYDIFDEDLAPYEFFVVATKPG